MSASPPSSTSSLEKDEIFFVSPDDVTPEDPSTSTDSSQQAAYDPSTGEINWDCPCLGGMAKGPCGDEFKAAFSCFVYSQDKEGETKGSECVPLFQAMQGCFMAFPEYYADQLERDEDAAETVATTAEDEQDKVVSEQDVVAEVATTTASTQ